MEPQVFDFLAFPVQNGHRVVSSAPAKYPIGDDEVAASYALKAIGQPYFQWSRYAILIAALGRRDEAQRYLKEVSRMPPDFSIKYVVEAHPFSAMRDLHGATKVCARHAYRK